MIHTITTATQTVTVGEYARAIKAVLAAPPKTEYKQSLCGWWPATREEIIRQFYEGMHDRINKHDPQYRKGRKWDQDWQRQIGHAARALNHPRLVIDWLPADLQKRFSYRLREKGDY